MAPRCSRTVTIALAFILSQLCVVYIHLNILNLRSFTVTECSSLLPVSQCNCRDKIQEIQDLQLKLKHLQARFDMEVESKESMNTTTKKDETINQKHAKQGTVSLPRPEKHDLANNIEYFAKFVTIILYKENNIITSSCLEDRQQALLQLFPKIEILISLTSSTVGSTFNSLIQRVRTKYFLFLDCQHELFPQTSDHSSGWLLHALENIPELDFVSGSILTGDHLEIPCYRLILCNWTLSQRYEYQRSIDELMICENIAPSFMGRTASIERFFVSKTHAFDDKITTLSTTDFFIRAKKAGALSGVRPEAIYKVCQDSKCNSNTTINKRDYFLKHLPFAHKHKVFRFKNSDSETLDLCSRESPILGEDICDESIAHGVMLDGGHWARLGTFAYPFIINNLQSCLFIVADFLESKGIPYSIDGGVAIGAVKMRSVLPWDSGDIDMFVFHKSRDAIYEVLAKFAKDNNYASSYNHQDPITFFCYPPNIAWKVGGIVTIYVHSEEMGSVMKIKTNGRWIPYMQVFRYLRHYYNVTYLQNKALSEELMHCKKEGHNACLPDFRKLEKYGKTGTFREFFCQT